MTHKMKNRINRILNAVSSDEPYSLIFHIFIIALILLNVLAVIFETVEGIAHSHKTFFRSFEVFSVTVFTIEYLLRLWVCNINDKYKIPVIGKIRFALTPMALIDLMAILPFYLPVIIPADLRFIRILRLSRMLRLFKMGRYSNSLKTLGGILKDKKEELIMTMISILVLLVIASSLMYFVENKAQPQAFSSIPAAMWWGVSTLTTVGYGDIYPVTPLGKFLGAIIAIFGIGMFAIPAGIVASGFAEKVRKTHEKLKTCPHCGKDVHEPNLNKSGESLKR